MTRHSDLAGKALGRYRLVRLLGEGGMGAVFEARDPEDRPVAIKVLRPDRDVTGRLVKRFVREAKLLARLKHPNAVQILDSGEAGGVLYMALELVPGRTLRAILNEETKLSPDRACGIAIAILEALAAAHELGIIHRDLKPENVMVAGERVKVLDFGLAKQIVREEVGTTALTIPGFAVGTIHYMPPEQLHDAVNVDARADIYSVGAVLYEMLSGALAFDAFTERELIIKKIQGQPPALRLLRPELSPALEAVVLKAIAREREERWSDAIAFARELEKARREEPGRGEALVAARRGRLRTGVINRAALETVSRHPEVGPGSMLGPYRMGRLLARTRTGDLHEAQDTSFERPVALKVAPAASLEALRLEAKLIARIGHPLAVDVVETGSAQGFGYSVLLLGSGRSLAEVARDGPFAPARAVACGLQILETLERLHELGGVHRDVTPENVLVTVEDGAERFRLVDFGLAAQPAASGRPDAPWASPEQLERETLDRRSDLYSVAALVRALIGEPKEGLAAVLGAALGPRDARPASAGAFARALEGAPGTPSRVTAESIPVARPVETERLGRYKLADVIGGGVLGTVHRALQLDLRRPVALRVIDPELAGDRDFVRALLRGLRLAARVAHPGIVAVHEVETEGRCFVVHELAPPRRLRDALAEGTIGAERACAMTLRLLAAIGHAHAQGAWHGALSPDAIALSPGRRGGSENPRILGLGLTPALLHAAGRGKDGLVAARPYFAADASEGSADLYALGLLLREMVGQEPVGPALAEVMARAVAPRGERYPDARSFGHALQAAARS